MDSNPVFVKTLKGGLVLRVTPAAQVPPHHHQEPGPKQHRRLRMRRRPTSSPRAVTPVRTCWC